MKYLERYLSKICDSPTVAPDRNDRNGDGETGNSDVAALTETTETTSAVSVSNVSDSRELSPDFKTPNLIPLFWRACIAQWPIPWRQKWGDRAEANQLAGMAWDVAEERAFDETMAEKNTA